MKRNVLLSLILLGNLYTNAVVAADTSAAVNYPVKPVRFIIAYPPGGAPDIMGRAIATYLSSTMGQQFIVDNRPGANGIIASDTTARSPRDGYTIQMGSVATHAINPALYQKVPYDPVKDFSFITQLGYTPLIITANPSTQIATIKDLIAAAKAKPGALGYGTSGVGSAGHLAGELFKTAAGINITHIPYKGMALATIDILGGQIPLTVGNLLNPLPYIKTGKLNGLGVTSLKRSPVLPETPAIAETVPGYEVILWWGMFAPPATPRPIINKLHDAIVQFLNQPELRERWGKEGTVLTGTTPEQLEHLVKTELEKWAKVVKASGARAD